MTQETTNLRKITNAVLQLIPLYQAKVAQWRDVNQMQKDTKQLISELARLTDLRVLFGKLS